ncbi:hypothetical protein LMG31886_42630 [Xanthomonas hydrangeae]|uniref:trypsin-like serine peptidase n=1 Tax=Xanthomonas hydrangeae TaxID=2775159 RepID=UPI001965BFC9|nr:hypothetical protein LMG31884_43710 [Xanthomonas hydrangeae]CAD7729587.1 hypothetical protein LMG31884_43710 [Xanthomonas hydrangeae]CAD7732330.1 hypothetical protein LMG31885_17760 [Xanthomonas hydrangeae]CAD7732333.1 hypothetical protein LMG31885_17760 [Xanthomonas hydrangeae]CAD7744946.1 hypothetical protein LMG31887_43630 [Xanthomonas hydrangeae]
MLLSIPSTIGSALAAQVPASPTVIKATSKAESTFGEGLHFSDEDAADAQRFWTPDKIAAAIPLDAGPSLDAEKSLLTAQMAASSPEGSYEPVYWIGRIYFDAGGKQYSCSGSSIQSDSKSIVATAAHCLYSAGEWSTRVVFIPAWDGANKPLLTWSARVYQVSRAWRNNEDQGHDAAFIKINPQPQWDNKYSYLADKAGASKVDFSLAKAGLHYQAFGYKNLSGFTAAPLFTCQGEARNFWGIQKYREQEIAGCSVPGGSSGGPVYHTSAKGPGGTQVGVITEQRKSRDGGPLLIFVPWGDLEYSLYRTVDAYN